jgi:signal transduction histidine kinase
MNLHRLLFFILLITSVSLAAQNRWPPVYEIKSDTSVKDIGDEFWQLLEDPGGKLGIKDIVTDSISARFHTNTARTKGLGFKGVKYFWQRLRLRNNTGKDISIVIVKTNPPDFDVYIFRENGIAEHKTNGWGVPINQRDDFTTRMAVKVSLKPGENIILYMRNHMDRSDVSTDLKLGYRSYDSFLHDEYIREPLYNGDTRAAFIAGLLIMCFILNLFFFFIVKEKVYFYYAMFLLLEGVWYLSLGTYMVSIWFPWWLRDFDLYITYSLFYLMVIQFVRHFLKTFTYYPVRDKIIVGITVLWLLLTFSRAYFFDYHVTLASRGILSLIHNSVFFLMNFLLLISFFYRKKPQDRFTGLAVMAAVPAFFMWSVVYFINNFFNFLSVRSGTVRPPLFMWLERNAYLVEMFFVAWFAVLFTWIMLQRYSLLRKQLTQQALDRERERSELMTIQKQELEVQVQQRTSELQQSLENLKNTQQQLVQSEKMASLGELTAGIAHEIQNPLNFVNNFSEVNKELIAEMNQLLDEGKISEARQVATDIVKNEEKITEHGKRADGIVKSMLQHSRSSSGIKEPADINELAEEYLKLAYHGLRARDKSFSAKFETDLDPSIGKIDIVSQDVGRVLLNLFNNAFYAVTAKKASAGVTSNYEPSVKVSTRKNNHQVWISVSDNGNGIPQRNLGKIFQPFFTTKPTGDGTGLGLSLAYDIITKGHGGDIDVKTKEGEGTEFIIMLPA